MKNFDDLHCVIYLNCDLSISELENQINNFLKGDINYSNITSKYFEIFLLKNNEFDSTKANNYQNDSFLYYKYRLDLEPIMGINQEIYISELSKLLKFFFSNNFKAVSACDFEDLLPKK